MTKNLNCKNTQYFLSLLESYSVQVTIHEYTRVNNLSQTCIDNIITNIGCDYYSEIINSHISDHMAQKLTFKLVTYR